jgi:hypothetical protein
VKLGTTFNRAARSRRGVAGILVGLAGVSLALSAALAGTAASAGGAAVPGLAVPAAAVPRLNAIAASFARENGGSRPDWVSAVITTHAKALDSATPGDQERAEAGTIVYLITMKGSFKAYGASVPPGAPIPTGTYLSVVVSSRTFAIMDWGLSPKAPPVSPASLGPVTRLRR